MNPLICEGGTDRIISASEQRERINEALSHVSDNVRRVLLLPPDHTRSNSRAGELTQYCYQSLSRFADVDIMPALGTHNPMSVEQLDFMFGDAIPKERFLVHDFRHDVRSVGCVPSERVREWSGGALDYTIDVSVNRRLIDGEYDLILSLGQVVPHEVVGMANFTKNVCIGVGGADMINKSHFLGAVHGMERIMGRTNTPVRRVLNWAFTEYLGHLPIYFVLTVMERLAGDDTVMRGLYMGHGPEVFASACRLSRAVNLEFLERPLEKIVVYLEPREFQSTWLGNKAIYRTRMAIADGGELIVLAPGLREFGEDAEIDRLIRQFGYRGRDAILAGVRDAPELAQNLSAAAHLIHGSSDDRFRITYCPGANMSHADLNRVGFAAADIEPMLARYSPDRLQDGYNVLPDGERIFFIRNPALGLWALADQFVDT